ncbi:putative uncharacterized protein DDB_G0282133 [Aphidius gifuensis]|uniref:putative uncharacterized protein DDB_G0282133 n=1 Tax=Aphidius gifuensis TaxID=684658 RepID=UPI001CDD0739|nr:putative uncharacterized protein DDB_G0282133 [Aphidius gifuensis]
MNSEPINDVKEKNIKLIINMDDQYLIDNKLNKINLFNQCNDKGLISVMEHYSRNLRSSVNECQTKPSRVEEIKDFMSENLQFFFYYYKMMQANCERKAYLDLMSDLLEIYIDMELKVSKISIEEMEKISDRLTKYLYIYLDNSVEHMLDTLIKIQFISSTYHHILSLLIPKILKIVPSNPKIDSKGTMYVRYFLIYSFWKLITNDQILKNNINKFAHSSLSIYPISLSDDLKDNVLPKVPNDNLITTNILLSLNFDIIKSCQNFIKHTKILTTKQQSEKLDTSKLEDNNLMNNNNINLPDNLISNNSSKLHENIINQRKKKHVLPPGQVLLVDLTSDKASGRIIRDKEQMKKKLLWLKEIGKKKNNNNLINNNEDMKNIKFNNEDFTTIEEAYDIKLFNINDDNVKKQINDDFNLWLDGMYQSINYDNDNITTTTSTIKLQEISVNEKITEDKDKKIEEPVSTNTTDEHKRKTVLHLNHQFDNSKLINNDNELSSLKIKDVEFNDHTDGLTLLASVSQHVLDLETSQIHDKHQEIINVIDYNKLKLNIDNSTDSCSNSSSIYYSNYSDNINYDNRIDKQYIINDNEFSKIYPDDDIDRIGLNVEVTSSEDTFNQCTSTVYHNNDDNNYQQDDKVILNGETVVLLQKSPNSNLYIINKAIENDNELIKLNDEKNSYMYDKKYSIQNDNKKLAKNDLLSLSDHAICENDIKASSLRTPTATLSSSSSTSTATTTTTTKKYNIKNEYNDHVEDNPTSTSLYHHSDNYFNSHNNKYENNEKLFDQTLPHSTTTSPDNNKNWYNSTDKKKTILINDCNLNNNNNKLYKFTNDKEIENDNNIIIKNNLNYHLPPKKRFNFGNKNYNNIINENNNYTSEPMISIASLQNNNKNDNNSKKIIRRNYNNDNNYCFINNDNKINNKKNNNSKKRCNDGQISRPSKKVKEQLLTPMKNLKKQTRSSQRKVPKVNYCYNDIETEWKPSTDNNMTRKKKKTNQ